VDEDGQPLSGFDAATFRRALGDRFFTVARGDLARVIFDQVEDGVETLYSTSVEAVRQDGPRICVTLSGGREREFDLVVGADGLRSRVRECVFGSDERFERYLGYGASSFVADDYPHRDEGSFLSFARPGRQISRYALRGGRSAFLFVFAHDGPLQVGRHDVAAQKRLLRERFGAYGWESAEILARLDEARDLYFDAVSQVQAPTWSVGRVVLVGDAAYCPSLLSGAGAAFAMLGARVLAGELARAPGDVVGALAAYERRLRPFMERQQRRAVRFASSFAPRSALGLWVRNSALKLMRNETIAAWYAHRAFQTRFELPRYG
jgi:2-polyprenyl-6-methoxyphenol hydroxylase-like FAD-dependent oxidoreductase